MLNQHILGVDISKIGLKKVMLHPYIGELKNVKGMIPTRHGDIAIAWFKIDENNYEYHCNIPKELEWEGVFDDNISVFINGELYENAQQGIT
ncbi:alpha-L-rhamnosidase C-terminal domain-containing protein [Gracilibacillus sp. JCM 18860]|uniref:alpha-L-rhamnosidase C-terminal domain-containing protein n=1 Tax=Gracilibacillus sp. JCM 18860 TaxID=1306159 RepID=UPI0006CF2F9E